jgi:hypothetical protein
MSLTLRTSLGCTEAIIADDGGLKRFYQVADILSQDFNVRFIAKEDDFDTIDWGFRFKGHDMTLHYNIYTGVSLYSARTKSAESKDNKAVVDLAGILENRLLNFDTNRKIA